MSRIVIIGNGISGASAALKIRELSDHDISMISEESLQPFARTALMYIYMGHLKKEHTYLQPDQLWQEKKIERILARVIHVDTWKKNVLLDNGREIPFDKLIIASGSYPRSIGCPGENLNGVQGLYHLHDLESMEQHSSGLQRAVVVGGGLIGVEMAEMLSSRGIQVSFLVRENGFASEILPDAESKMVARHLSEQGIDLRLTTELREIHSDENGNVSAITDSHGRRIVCGFVGITVGVRPNIPVFVPENAVDTNIGILVDEYLQCSHPDIYAVGDCAEIRNPEPGRSAIEAVWYTGRLMGQTVAETICIEPRPYRPGIWFNSAKFFDIEYQTYGFVPSKPSDRSDSLYWEHPSGKKSIRICFSTDADRPVIGFTLMGTRYRQEVCERWIKEKKPLSVVLQNLAAARFDPEFFQNYDEALVKEYNSRYNPAIAVKTSQKRNRMRTLISTFLPSEK